MSFRLVRTITGVVGGDTGIIFSIVLDRHFCNLPGPRSSQEWFL